MTPSLIIAASAHDLEKGGVVIALRRLSEGRVYPAQFGAILPPAHRGTRHPIRSLGRTTGFRLHACEHQLPIQFIAAAPSHLNRLSMTASSAGSKNASKRGQGLGNLIHRLGSIVRGSRHYG